MRLLNIAALAAAAAAAAAATTTTATTVAPVNLAQFTPDGPGGDPIGSTKGLIGRVIGDFFLARVQLEVIPAAANGNDVFELDATPDGKLVVRGNNGVALSMGLGYWLKYYTNSSWSWGRLGSGNLIQVTPATGALPLPATRQRIESPVAVRYAYNVCTYGYSTVWWDWSEWQAELDRLALWGINRPLAFNGQEYVIRALYRSYGLNDSDLAPYFSGPAFLPWQRMGNMKGWGGPLDDDWITGQRDLQHLILARMRSFGMTPVLAGFAGHVPNAITRVYPNASVIPSAGWGNFNATYSDVLLLEPTDPLFVRLGTDFHKAMLAEYGDPTGAEVPHFNSDTFNEMDPSSSDPSYLKETNAVVYKSMVDADPRSIYVMQAWLFHSGFWNNATVYAYLSGVPVGKLLILDLNTEDAPVWSLFDNFYGHTWVWNALLVYGGRRGLYGDLATVLQSPSADHAQAPNMVGIGITPEAIDEVPLMFDAALEAGWRNASVDAGAWIQQFAVRRYGRQSPSISSAMALLLDAAYSRSIDTTSVEKLPELMEESEPGNSHNTDPDGILGALRLFVAAAAGGEVDATTGPWSYDLTDLARQVLCNVFADAHELLGGRFTALQAHGVNNTAEVATLVSFLRGLLADLDALTSADPNYLLGTWLADASEWAFNGAELSNRLLNAKNQITLWGPDGEIIDYAAKNWAGLISSFYGVRWGIFFDYLLNATATGVPPDWDQYYADELAFSRAWGVNDTQAFPAVPSGGNPTALAAGVLAKYAPSDASGYTVLANMDAGLPAPPVFHQIGGANEAAVSPDCPYTAHGDGSSLANCQAACGADPVCNAINWNPSIGDCVFRACSNPAAPTLTPTDGYSVFTTTTSKGAGMLAAWHKDPAVLRALCDADPACAGFSSRGILKSNVTAPVAANGVTLYVKKAQPAAAQAVPYAPDVLARRAGRPIVPSPRPTPASPRRRYGRSAQRRRQA